MSQNPSMSLGAFLTMILVIGLGIFVCNKCITDANSVIAAKEFNDWLKITHPNDKLEYIICTSVKDDNGFIPCTYKLENDSEKRIDCAGAYSFQKGCKIPNVQVTVD